METDLSRRRFIAATATAGAAALPGVALPGAARGQGSGPDPDSGSGSQPAPEPAIGAGGDPTDLPTLARVAAEQGRGEPLTFFDLAALDSNRKLIVDFAQAQGWAVRPALKTFRSPRLDAYVLRTLPQPRGLIFHLRELEFLLTPELPQGTDLLTGYPPSFGELRHYVGTTPPANPLRKRISRVRITFDSVALLEEAARVTRASKRPLPLDVALEFDAGGGRGGLKTAEEVSAATKVLRGARDRLRLGATICYDGHATFESNPAFRRTIAIDAQRRYRAFLDQLAAEGGDLYDASTLVRNGPGSSNYRNWEGSDECNEISPGHAFLFHGYITGDDYENEGLRPTITHAAPVFRITGDNPSVPLLPVAAPGARREELLIKGGGWVDSDGDAPAYVFPADLQDDDLSGGRGGTNASALTAPKGSLKLGDYVLLRPRDGGGSAFEYFDGLDVVRGGTILRRWAIQPRWGALAAAVPPVQAGRPDPGAGSGSGGGRGGGRRPRRRRRRRRRRLPRFTG